MNDNQPMTNNYLSCESLPCLVSVCDRTEDCSIMVRNYSQLEIFKGHHGGLPSSGFCSTDGVFDNFLTVECLLGFLLDCFFWLSVSGVFCCCFSPPGRFVQVLDREFYSQGFPHLDDGFWLGKVCSGHGLCAFVLFLFLLLRTLASARNKI